MKSKYEQFELDERVVDRFKIPRRGDECVAGRVIKVEQAAVTVQWDDGRISTVNERVLRRAP